MSSRPPSLFGPIFGLLYSVYAGLVFCVVTFILICPLILVIPGVARKRRLAALGVRLGLALMLVPYRIRGREHLPPGPCIVVCNHASYYDGLLMTAALPPRFSFVIQHGVSNWFYAGAVIRAMGYLFVNRENARAGAMQTRQMLKALKSGESLAIFAEGTFKAPPGLLPFKTGAFMLAHKTGLPVVPVAIRGSRRLLGGGSVRPRWSFIDIDIGEPILPTLDAYVLRDSARAAVLAMCGEPDLQPQNSPTPAGDGDSAAAA